MAFRPTLRFTLPCTLRHRALAVRLVAEACRLARGDDPRDASSMSFDMCDPFDAEFVTAFAEIYNNIVLHAYGRRIGEIDIAIDVGEGCITVEVRDTGASFDPCTIPEPDLDALPEGGMGLHIARAMVDEVVYEPGPPNLWRLVKRHRRPDSTPTPTRPAVLPPSR